MIFPSQPKKEKVREGPEIRGGRVGRGEGRRKTETDRDRVRHRDRDRQTE